VPGHVLYAGRSGSGISGICQTSCGCGARVGKSHLHLQHNSTNFNTPKTANRDKFVKELDDTEAEILKRPASIRILFDAVWCLREIRPCVAPADPQRKGYALVHWSFGTDWFLKKRRNRWRKNISRTLFREPFFFFTMAGVTGKRRWRRLKS